MDSSTFDAAPYSLLAFLAEAAKAKRTGTLRVQRDGHIQTAYLKEGRVAYASSSVGEEKFEAVLKAMGLVGDKELALAKEKKEGKESLGRTLMRLGFISNQDLYKAAVHQTELIATKLVAHGGETLFEEGKLPDNLADLKVSAEQLLREMAQGISDRELVMGALGGERGALHAGAVPPGISLAPEEQALVDKLRQPATVGSLIAGPAGGFPAAKRLYFLLLLGAVEPAGSTETEAPTVAMTASPLAPPAAPPASASTVKLPRESFAVGDGEPTVTDAKQAKFTTAELPPHGDAKEVKQQPFVAMENLALLSEQPASKRKKPPVPTFGMEGAAAQKPRKPRGGKSSGGGGKWLGILLGVLLLLAGAYWYLAAGPGATQVKLPVPLPWPESLAALRWPASVPAPANVPAKPPAPASSLRPAVSAPRPTPLSMAGSASAAPVSPPVPPPPASVAAPLKPASAPASPPAPAADGWTLLTRADYPAAAQFFKAQLTGAKGYTLRSVVLCKPQESAANKVAGLPAGSPYMLLPVTYNGNACYRQCYGRYATLAQAQQAKAQLPALLRDDAWTPLPYADAMK